MTQGQTAAFEKSAKVRSATYSAIAVVHIGLQLSIQRVGLVA